MVARRTPEPRVARAAGSCGFLAARISKNGQACVQSDWRCSACSLPPSGAPSPAPTAVPSAYPEVAPAPIEAPAPAADLDLHDTAIDLPAAGNCDAAPEADPRCPDEVLTAAALSYLDKTVAEFDGRTMKVIEYDHDALLAEAYADPGFRRLLQHADVAPADGVLDHAEARTLEAAVLSLLEAKVARR